MALAVRKDVLTDRMIDEMKTARDTLGSVADRMYDDDEFRVLFYDAVTTLIRVRDEIVEKTGLAMNVVGERLSDLMHAPTFDLTILTSLFE